jgi:hypothetical protein
MFLCDDIFVFRKAIEVQQLQFLHDFWGTKTQRITVVLGQNGAKQPVKF